MNVKLRLTVVALLPNDVRADSFQLFVERKIGTIEPGVASKLYQTTPQELGVELTYAKISKVIERDEVSSGWHLQVTERFKAAGCENVAWRVTEIAPGDIEPENTTETFPIELFRGSFTKGIEVVNLRYFSPTAFGSESFWEYFEDDE